MDAGAAALSIQEVLLVCLFDMRQICVKYDKGIARNAKI